MEKKYPIGGYAPGDYWHKACNTCGKEFTGDKRAWNCEPCGEKNAAVEKKLIDTYGYEDLSDYLNHNHQLKLLQSEMSDLIHFVHKSHPQAPAGPVWVKGVPTERKLFHARFKGHLSDDIHDGTIEPVKDPEYWQAIASGVRISIKGHHIIEYLDESGAAPSGERDNWIDVNDRLPEEGGRYWCYVEEVTDLGISHFQWNCSYNQNEKRFSDQYLKGGRVTHWRELPPPPKQKQC